MNNSKFKLPGWRKAINQLLSMLNSIDIIGMYNQKEADHFER